MKRNYLIPAILGLALSLFSCESGEKSSDHLDLADSSFSSVSSPIVGGKLVTGSNKLSTVALYHDKNGKNFTFCTGTLISPNYVLTAGHCVADCDEDGGVEELQPYTHIGIGQNDKNFIATYDIKSFHPHPNFICKKGDIQNDIAIIALKTPVPSSVATPSLIIPRSMVPTADYLDELRQDSRYIVVNVAGFGITAANTNTNGTKREVDLLLLAICPLNGAKSAECTKYDLPAGFHILTYGDEQGVRNSCNGDSGGPNFLVSKSGKEYLYGVTSHGDEDCEYYAGITNIDDYRSFIHGIADDANADDPEDCTNGKDDNGDGRFDCQDPYCQGDALCDTEICDNGIDDNDDGMADCDDFACRNETACKQEICDNGIDDNGNGKKDCDDVQCLTDSSCVPEICDNGIDDNDNNKTDCDDAQCKNDSACKGSGSKPDDNPKPGTNPDDSNCGNGALDDYEDCDGDLFADDKTLCSAWQKVYKSGSVSCNSDCTINYDSCSTESAGGSSADTGKKPNSDEELDKELDKILKDAGCSQSGQSGNPATPLAFLILAAAMASLRRRKSF